MTPAAAGLPVDRLAFVPAYLFGLEGFEGPINLFAGVVGAFSYPLTHDGAAHLFANVAGLALFGPAVEARLGARRLLLLFFISSLVAALAEGLMTADRLTPLAGASGGASGLMGALAVLAPRLRLMLPAPRGGVSFLIIWLTGADFAANLALGVLSTSEVAPLLENLGSTAWRAHMAGAVFGAAVGLALRCRCSGEHAPVRLRSGFARGGGVGLNALTAAIWLAAAMTLVRAGG